jgi:DNA-binding CsgD family transcriptional regulator
MILGGALHTLWSLGLFSDTLAGSASIFILQSVLVGVSASLFRIEIDRIFGHVGANQTLFIAFAGMLMATAVVVALTLLPQIAWLSIQLIFPVILFLCFKLAIKNVSHSKYYAHGLENKLFIPMKFLSTSFFQGIAFGVMSGGMLLLSSLDSGWIVGTGSRLLALLLIGIVVLYLRLDFNQLLYKIGFPFMALGFVCLLVLPSVPQIGGILAWSGYLFLDIILWSLGAHLIKNAGLPATWIASFPGAALSAGTLIGVLIGTFAVTQGGQYIVTFGGLMAAFLLAVALVMTSSRNIRFGWGTSRPYHDDSEHEDQFFEICHFLSSEYNLTKRESDVLLCLILNQKRKEISESLCVSLDTVKTHTSGIYRKLLIHSHGELQEMVRATAIQLDRPLT